MARTRAMADSCCHHDRGEYSISCGLGKGPMWRTTGARTHPGVLRALLLCLLILWRLASLQALHRGTIEGILFHEQHFFSPGRELDSGWFLNLYRKEGRGVCIRFRRKLVYAFHADVLIFSFFLLLFFVLFDLLRVWETIVSSLTLRCPCIIILV